MFLPVTKKEIEDRGWQQPDFIYVSGDAYVDHPSFGHAIISRTLEAHGFKVAVLSQPDIRNREWPALLGEPRLGFLVSAGNIDSMVNHYYVSGKRREKDYYSPGGKPGLRPDHCTITYSRAIKRMFPDKPVLIGGVEASLRRLTHYDYIDDRLKKSVLLDSKADLLMYGMGERHIVEIAEALNSGMKVSDVVYVEGTVWKTKNEGLLPEGAVVLPPYEELTEDRRKYAESFAVQYKNTDPFTAKPLVEKCGGIFVVQNVPSKPLSREEMDFTYSLPYERTCHPSYLKDGGIPATEEIENSVTVNRGCFGNCSFCAIAMHQGRIIQSRSKESVLEEAGKIIKGKSFKGYIHDIGGPTANFYRPACKKQERNGACPDRQCLFPEKCKNAEVSHEEYLDILTAVRKLDGVKKVFVRSGIRYDYLYYDKDEKFFRELVRHHISGQLKVAPEHISDRVLRYMQKPGRGLYTKFVDKFKRICREEKKDYYLIPYLMSSHPGCRLSDMVELAEYLRDEKLHIEQVQDFYPTPSTLSTAMYYTGLDPRTMEKVYVAKTKEEKAMQRALIQYSNPNNYDMVKQALIKCGREDLIGNGPKCLIPASKPGKKFARIKK